MKKVLFVMGSMRKGGAERVASKICNYLASNFYDVYIVTLLSPSVEYDLDKRIHVINLYNGKRNIVSVLGWIKGLKNIIKEIKPNSIISFAGRVNIVTLLSAKKNSVIVSERNDPRHDTRTFVSNFLCNYLYSTKAKKIVFQTNEIKRLYCKKIQRKSVVLPNPVSIPKEIKKDYSDGFHIVMIGRLAKQKNYSLAIEALQDIRKQHDCYIDIYGEGELKDKLVNDINEAKLNNYVTLKGVTNDPIGAMLKHSIFMMTSDYEGFSNALLEAMSIGMPCISTPVAGANEILDGTNGILLKNHSVKELKTALELLISSQNLREKIGKNALKTAEFFYENKILEKWQALLEG